MSFAKKIAYATSTPREEFKMTTMTAGLDASALLELFILINHMGTCHPLEAHRPDSPFLKTVDIFKTLPAETMEEVFFVYCLYLVQKLKAVDTEEIPPTAIPRSPTINYERLTCVLNLISDLTFVPTVKAILTKEYVESLKIVLEAQYGILKSETHWVHKNRSLAQEIYSELFMKR